MRNTQEVVYRGQGVSNGKSITEAARAKAHCCPSLKIPYTAAGVKHFQPTPQHKIASTAGKSAKSLRRKVKIRGLLYGKSRFEIRKSGKISC